MFRVVLICSILSLLPAVSGCVSCPDIVVVDTAGQPIAGATVVGTSLSIGGQTSTTNSLGQATTPWAIQETKWIEIRKPGFITVSDIDVNQKKLIRVVLNAADGG